MQEWEDYNIAISEINRAFNVNLRMTCYGAPVQAEGDVDGCKLYFRARWEEWRLAIAKNFDDAVLGENCIYITGGESDGPMMASYMPPDEMRAILHRCLTEYKAR